MSQEGPTQDQLDLIGQMNQMLKDQAALWEKVGNAMSGAMNASQQMKNASEQSAEASNQQADATERVNEAMKENVGGADGLAAALGRSGDQSKVASGGLANLADKAGKATAAYGLLKVGMDTVSNVGSMLGGTFDLLSGGLSGYRRYRTISCWCCHWILQRSFQSCFSI